MKFLGQIFHKLCIGTHIVRQQCPPPHSRNGKWINAFYINIRMCKSDPIRLDRTVKCLTHLGKAFVGLPKVAKVSLNYVGGRSHARKPLVTSPKCPLTTCLQSFHGQRIGIKSTLLPKPSLSPWHPR